MKGIIDVLQEEVKQAFEKAGYDGKYAKVTISNRPGSLSVPVQWCACHGKRVS